LVFPRRRPEPHPVNRNSRMGVCQSLKGLVLARANIARGFAKLHGDGKPKAVGHRIPDDIGSGYWAGAAVAEHIAALKQR
jgi:hypothetical protein